MSLSVVLEMPMQLNSLKLREGMKKLSGGLPWTKLPAFWSELAPRTLAAPNHHTLPRTRITMRLAAGCARRDAASPGSRLSLPYSHFQTRLERYWVPIRCPATHHACHLIHQSRTNRSPTTVARLHFQNKPPWTALRKCGCRQAPDWTSRHAQFMSTINHAVVMVR